MISCWSKTTIIAHWNVSTEENWNVSKGWGSGKSTPPLPATWPEFEFQPRHIFKNCAVVLSEYSPFPISLKTIPISNSIRMIDEEPHCGCAKYTTNSLIKNCLDNSLEWMIVPLQKEFFRVSVLSMKLYHQSLGEILHTKLVWRSVGCLNWIKPVLIVCKLFRVFHKRRTVAAVGYRSALPSALRA